MYMLNLGYNMWNDFTGPMPRQFHPDLRVDRPLWDEITNRLVDAGANSILIDLGDGVRWDSHPEIAVNGAWTPDQLGEEVERLRSIGLEPFPKLNFSACHDVWLGEYARMVSTRTYYQVCTDLINEAATLFGSPQFFHLGMDEEDYDLQRDLHYVVIRQKDLWWHDVNLLADVARAAGSRPWVWADPMWFDLTYLDKMARDVVQSHWYYTDEFAFDPTGQRPRLTVDVAPDRTVTRDERPLCFLDLDEHGFDQIPTGSSWSSDANMELLTRFCLDNVSPDRLLGFLQTPWRPTQTPFADRHFASIDQLGRARELGG